MQLDASARGTDSEEPPYELPNREFSVYGKFKLGERDPGGFDYVWMTVEQILECENVTQEEVDQARMTWRAAQDEDWPTCVF